MGRAIAPWIWAVIYATVYGHQPNRAYADEMP